MEGDSPVAHRGLRVLRSLAKGAPRTTREHIDPPSALPPIPTEDTQQLVNEGQQSFLDGEINLFDLFQSAAQEPTVAPTLQDLCNLNFEDLAGMDFGNALLGDGTVWPQYPN